MLDENEDFVTHTFITVASCLLCAGFLANAIDVARKSPRVRRLCRQIIGRQLQTELAADDDEEQLLTSQRSVRPGRLRFFFHLVCFGQVVLAALPIIYGFTQFARSGRGWAPAALFDFIMEKPIRIAFSFANAKFWAICLSRMISNRFCNELPLMLIISYGAASMIITFPLFIFSSFFPGGFSDRLLMTYYGVAASFVYAVFIAAITKATLPQTYYTPWDNAFQKIVRIWPYVWPKKSRRLQLYVYLSVITLIVGRVTNVLIPLYGKWVVDALSERPAPRFCVDLILIASALKFLQGGSGMGGGFLNTVRSFLWIRVQQYTTIELEVDLLRHLHELSLRWHLSRKTGEVLRVMDRGTASTNTLLSYLLFNVVPTILDIALAAGFFFIQFNAYFGMLVVLTMAIYLGTTIFLTEWRSKYRKRLNDAENYASSIGVDSLLNYETIKYYNAEALEVARYRKAYEVLQAAEYESTASLNFLNLSQNIIIGVGLTMGSVLAAWMISSPSGVGSGLMTAGDYVLFTTYILQLYGPLNFFGTIYRTVQRSFIDMENMLELFEQEPEIKDSPDAVELIAHAGSLEFRNVDFHYKPEKPVLRDVSFRVEPGETLALVGPSGSGKTTIVRLLFRLFDVKEGQILFNDTTDIRDLQLNSLRQRIGIVPQDTVLFNDTILSNIRFGRPSASFDEVVDAAKAAAIHRFISSHPDRYECLVGERGLKLSGGEKQRVAIARTILKQPEYILLDEATSALDSKTERQIQRYLFELCRRRTCVVVAHRLSTIIHAQKIIVLKSGRVVESGKHDELLALGGVYAEMWSLQQHQQESNADAQSNVNGGGLLDEDDEERDVEENFTVGTNGVSNATETASDRGALANSAFHHGEGSRQGRSGGGRIGRL